MTKTAHRLYIGTLAAIVVVTAMWLGYYGVSYYGTPLEERFFHPQHSLLKPSGPLGHGLGIVGTLMILFGVTMYMARKRYRALARFGVLKHWLEFHIFLCTLGPILILYHTAFKFGGIVSVSFWSMVAVVISGVIGRFIYIQIPRTIQGRELTLNEVRALKSDIGTVLQKSYQLAPEQFKAILTITDSADQKASMWQRLKVVRQVRKIVKETALNTKDGRKLIGLVRNEVNLNARIERLATMQRLFKYWHVAHLPFALIMLIIMVIHVVVTLALGYKWIF